MNYIASRYRDRKKPAPYGPGHAPGDVWYRYEDRLYSVVVDADREEYGTRMEVERREYVVDKVTPKGVWLLLAWYRVYEGGEYKEHKDRRFVLFTARKKFANATDTLARHDFRMRKLRQAAIHDGIANRARKAIEMLDKKGLWF